VVAMRYRINVQYVDNTKASFIGFIGALNSQTLNAWDTSRYWAVATTEDGFSFTVINLDHAQGIGFVRLDSPEPEDAKP